MTENEKSDMLNLRVPGDDRVESRREDRRETSAFRQPDQGPTAEGKGRAERAEDKD